MIVEKVVTGFLDENCYILIKDGNCLIIDPGDDYIKIKKKIADNKIVGILITHSHRDHIGALRDVLNKCNAPLYKKSSTLENEYDVKGFKFNVIYTPGHSNDSITFYFKDENVMFTGDFLFKESIGRCDLPTGDMLEMKKSLEKIRTYQGECLIYPGHGEDSTLGYEFSNNQYLNEV